MLMTDLTDHKQEVSIEAWIDAVLAIPPRTLFTWISIIKEKKWFEDPTINRALREFCAASEETERYEPFCNMANRVLHLAQHPEEGLPDVPGTYPISDIGFFRNDPLQMIVQKEENIHAAQRSPDVLCIRSRESDALVKGDDAQKAPGLGWSSVLFFCEFKEEGNKVKLPFEALRRPASEVS